MSTHRWDRIQELFEASLDLSESERDKYLREQCAGDDALYSEVIALIEADSDPHPLLKKSHDELLSHVTKLPGIGERFAQYEILEPLGSGGMGDVFVAIDTDLKRKVAVKFLPQFTSANDKAAFLREAQLAAALNHPNIITIHEITEYDGVPCIIMELADGLSLRQLITDSTLRLESKYSIAAQICEGLAAAHRAGIIHRDIKPENLIVNSDGRVKILDFGIARSLEAKRSSKREVVGTPGYMSPEQAVGDVFDHRSDIFSLGAVLYEMFSGKAAFRRETIKETLSATINSTPDSLSRNAQVPIEMQKIVDRCLAKHHDQRYQSAGEVLNDLAPLRQDSAAAIVQAPAVSGKPKVISLAVLHLKTLGPDEDDYIAYGVTEDLIVDLTRIGIIRVVPMRTILPLKDSDLSAKKLGRKLRVSHILEGSIQRRAELLQISAQIITVATGDVLYANRWQTTPADLPNIEKQLAESVCSAFNINPSIQMDAQIGTPITSNAMAYEHYLRGKYAFKRKRDSSDIEVALGLYRRALELEESLIAASCGIAEILILKGEKDRAEVELQRALSKARESRLRADEAVVLRLLARLYTQQSKWAEAMKYGEQSLTYSRELRDRSGEATTLGILINALLPQAGYDQALKFFERVIEIHQSLDNQDELGEALKNIGTLYRQRGDYTNAEKYYSEALELARRQENLALESASQGNLGTVYHCRNELDRAAESYKKALEIDTRLGNKVAIQAWLPNLAHVLGSKGDFRQALSYLEQAKALSNEIGDFKVYTHVLVSSADVSINMGRFAEAEAIASEAVETAQRIEFSPGLCYARHQLGLAKFWLGQHGQAFVELDKALETARQAKLRRSIAWLYLNIGEFRYHIREFDAARNSLMTSMDEAKQIGEKSVIDQCEAYLHALDARSGGVDAPTVALRSKFDSANPANDAKTYMIVLRLLAQVLVELGGNEAIKVEGRQLISKGLEIATERQTVPEIVLLNGIAAQAKS